MKFITTDVLRDMLKAANNYLKINTKKINALNVFPVPDGDTGTNMSATLDAAIREINGKSYNSIGELANAAAFGSLKGARGNSGVILSQLLRGFARELKDQDVIDIKTFVDSLKSAANSAYRAVMKPTEGTMLTVARGIAEDAQKALNQGTLSEIEDLIEICLLNGKKWLDKTPDMLPILKEANVVDAGGMGLVIIFEGIYKFLKEGNLFDDVLIEKAQPLSSYTSDEIRFTYCTEFFITGLNKNIEDEFKEYLQTLGDSIIVIQEGDLLKTHVHTNSPGKIIEKALKYGELINIKIDNMKYQHQEFIKTKIDDNKEPNKEETITKDYGFVAVSQGDGFNEILMGLGVDYIIEGGQTMNPSTEDFINAIEEVTAQNIFVFPNNKNVIMSAELAKQMISSKKNVIVVKTNNIPECIAALIRFDINSDVDTNINRMEEGINSIKTVEITQAIKDTKVNGFAIAQNDFIAIFNKEIIEVGKDLFLVAKSCVNKIVDERTQILSIYYGKNVDAKTIEGFIKDLKGEYSNIDIEGYESGNEVYHLIIVAEM